jgi:hypothetical protein
VKFVSIAVIFHYKEENEMKNMYLVALVVVVAAMSVGAVENEITKPAATSLAVGNFAAEGGLQLSDVDIFDTSEYHFSDKKWYVIKLGTRVNGTLKGTLYTIDSDSGEIFQGWDYIDEYVNKNREKIDPALKSKLKDKSLEKVKVVIVLNSQPSIRSLVSKAEESYSEQLVKSLKKKDNKGMKDVKAK